MIYCYILEVQIEDREVDNNEWVHAPLGVSVEIELKMGNVGRSVEKFKIDKSYT